MLGMITKNGERRDRVEDAAEAEQRTRAAGGCRLAYQPIGSAMTNPSTIGRALSHSG